MSAIKKLIKSAVEETLEIVKDSGEQIINTVSPDALINAATGVESPKPEATKENDMTAYLKSLGNGLEGDALKQKQAEVAQADRDQVATLRTYLQSTPAHMRLPPQQEELRAYDKTWQEMKEKEQKEAQKNQSNQLVIPTSKPTRGAMGKQRPKAANMELKHDNKSG